MQVSSFAYPAAQALSPISAAAPKAAQPMPGQDVQFSGRLLEKIKNNKRKFLAGLALMTLPAMAYTSPQLHSHMTLKDQHGNVVAYVNDHGDLYKPMPGLNFLEEPISHAHVNPEGKRTVHGDETVCQGTPDGTVVRFDKTERILDTATDEKGPVQLIRQNNVPIGSIDDEDNSLTVAQENGLACELFES